MPKIKITELDATGVIQQGVVSNTVFVPVLVKNTDGEYEVFDPVLVSSIGQLSELKTEYKIADLTDLEEGYTLDDVELYLGYRLCKHLIHLGFDVLVQGVYPQTYDPDTQTWTPGTPIMGWDPLTAEQWEALKDRGLYDIRFLTTGSFGAYSQSMIDCAAARGDCIALCNVNELADDFSYAATSVRDAFGCASKTQAITGGEYAAAFTPWFYSTNGDFINSDGGVAFEDQEIKIVIPAAFGYLFAYANSLKRNPEWYAVAGFQRGIIPELSEVLHDYSSADIEVLQARSATENVDLDHEDDNVGVAINPIANIRPAGYIIYGNRTMNLNDSVTKTIATSFLNVRNMVSAIKKVLYTAARKYTFEQNTEVLWINFQAYVRPLLDAMQTGNGLLGYRFIRLATTAKARLKARLKIVPVEGVEDFELEVYLANDLEIVE